jgi:hypothetical protein
VPLVRVEDHEQAVSVERDYQASRGSPERVRDANGVDNTGHTADALLPNAFGDERVLFPGATGTVTAIREALERKLERVRDAGETSRAAKSRLTGRSRTDSPANYPGFQPACILRLTRQALIAHAVAAVTGLPAEIMSTLFTPFVTTKSHGLGIGLTIARRIVEAHDGTIDAHENLNGGATFTVTLPRSAAPKLL